MKKSLVLESCIKITKQNITPKRVLFEGVCFHLNKDVVRKIAAAKINREQLYLSSSLLADWRYYALFAREGDVQSGLKFSTYYQQQNSEKLMIRSMICLDGDAINQICSDCLENQALARQILAAHYWLIEQMIVQLSVGLKYSLNLIAWLLCLPIAIAIILAKFKLFNSLNSLYFLALLPIVWLLQQGIKHLLPLLFKYLRHWLWEQLLFGVFSRRQRTQKIALDILAIIGF